MSHKSAQYAAVSTIGIDLGKNSFHLIGLDQRGAIVLQLKCSRAQLERRLANIPCCLIGMEACSGAHYIARQLSALGHDVRLIPAQYVKPFLKGHKNDYRDAEAIAAAVQRPTMHFVAIKTPEQMDLLALHRVRSRLVGQRTGVINQIRGFLIERGITVRQGVVPLRKAMADILSSNTHALSPRMVNLIADLVQDWRRLDERIAAVSADAITYVKTRCGGMQLRGVVATLFGGILSLTANAASANEPLKLPDSQLKPAKWSEVAGWTADDHLAAFAAYQTSCQQGFLTGYYEPVVQGSRFPSPEFHVPVYRRPPGLVAVGYKPGSKAFPNKGTRVGRRNEQNQLVPYYDRGAIEAGALDGQKLEICWLKDPFDLLALQIEGSGRVILEDGTPLRVNFDSHNGYSFTSISRALIERNLIPREEMSMQRIREWMAAHPDEAAKVRTANRSYVFFRITGLSNEGEPVGAQGVPLMPGRSMAVDRLHEYGTPFFIDAKLPVESTKRVSSFRRLMIAQDTGSAIVGPARADLYMGAGDDAARIAGRIRHSGRFVILLPRELDMIAAGRQMPLPAPKPKISEFVEVNKQEQRNIGSADENWQRQVLTRKPAKGGCATGSGMDCGGKSVSVSAMSPSTQRGRAGSNQEQQRQQQQAQPQGMHGRGGDRQQPVAAGRGPQQKQPAQTSERRVPQQKQLPPATEGRGG